MNQIMISLIVPVYNAEKYIRVTLDSICSQSFRDFEVILINDGSKDHSYEILQEYKEKLPNAIIIDQENTGVSATRNKGIRMANGKYICFADSDDILHKEYLQILYTMMKNGADIALCEYETFYDEKQININHEINCVKQEVIEIPKENAFSYVMDLGLGTSPCIKIYKKELLLKYDIVFDEKSSFGEDMFFNWKAFLAATRILYVKSKLYFYRQSSQSTTLRFHPDLYENYMREYESVRYFVRKNKLDKIDIPCEIERSILDGRCPVDIEYEISINLIERIPSFLRMDIRQPGSLWKKYQRIKALVNKVEIQASLEIYEKKKTLNKVFLAVKQKKYLKVFYYACMYEYRFRLSRFIKNII